MSKSKTGLTEKEVEHVDDANAAKKIRSELRDKCLIKNRVYSKKKWSIDRFHFVGVIGQRSGIFIIVNEEIKFNNFNPSLHHQFHLMCSVLG